MCCCLSKPENSDNYILAKKIFGVYKEKKKVYKCFSKLKIMSSVLWSGSVSVFSWAYENPMEVSGVCVCVQMKGPLRKIDYLSGVISEYLLLLKILLCSYFLPERFLSRLAIIIWNLVQDFASN